MTADSRKTPLVAVYGGAGPPAESAPTAPLAAPVPLHSLAPLPCATMPHTPPDMRCKSGGVAARQFAPRGSRQPRSGVKQDFHGFVHNSCFCFCAKRWVRLAWRVTLFRLSSGDFKRQHRTHAPVSTTIPGSGNTCLTSSSGSSTPDSTGRRLFLPNIPRLRLSRGISGVACRTA